MTDGNRLIGIRIWIFLRTVYGGFAIFDFCEDFSSSGSIDPSIAAHGAWKAEDLSRAIAAHPSQQEEINIWKPIHTVKTSYSLWVLSSSSSLYLYQSTSLVFHHDC
jgi:hypothetical protein